jgi:predicted DsbA family dithiol-disulfide isomerase
MQRFGPDVDVWASRGTKNVANPIEHSLVQIDIVSDVMCPWCVVGFKHLEQALGETGVRAQVRWHPFELNPDMPEDGQNLAEHIAEKYGSTPAQSAEARARLTTLGDALGFAFRFREDSRIVNTFAAHQLLDWAESHGRQHPLQMALFSAYFTDGRDVSDHATLAEIAGQTGLDESEALRVLASGEHATAVRQKQQFWTSRGISAVPSMVFGQRHLLTGAQGADIYAEILRRVSTNAEVA